MENQKINLININSDVTNLSSKKYPFITFKAFYHKMA